MMIAVFQWAVQEPSESTTDYDYMSDSDLDDYDDQPNPEHASASTNQSVSELSEKKSTHAVKVSPVTEEAAEEKDISANGTSSTSELCGVSQRIVCICRLVFIVPPADQTHGKGSIVTLSPVSSAKAVAFGTNDPPGMISLQTVSFNT